MDINDRVKMLRGELKLSMNDFGSQIGLSYGAISMIERKVNKVTERTLKAIVENFKVNEAWLRTGMGDMFIQHSTDEEIGIFMADILKDSPDFRKALISVLARMTPDEWVILEKKVLSVAEEYQRQKEVGNGDEESES